MKKILALLLLMTAGSALAESIIATEPVAPTDQTPVTLVLTTDQALCPVSQTVRNEARTITWTIVASAVCQPLVPGPSKHTVSAGLLTPGLYTLRVQSMHGDAISILGDELLVVRSATPRLTVTPSFVFGSGPVQITGASQASDVVIGGTAVTFTEAGGVLSILAPTRLTRGTVDVTVRLANGTVITEPSALLYLAEEPPPSVVEPVLFPVLDSVQGGFGSEWISEGAIYNGNSSTVLPYSIVFPQLLCSPTPWCDQAFPPGGYRAFRGHNFPQGALMYVSRDQAAAMSYSLRVRDTSRGTSDYGAEIPVVRERDFKTQTFQLLDVPVLETFRTKVRIYAIDALEATIATLQVTRASDLRTPVFVKILPLEPEHCDDGGPCRPAYAEIDLQSIAELRGIDRVVVSVTVANAKAWAFATVTNNTTQSVTTVTPR